MKAIPRVVQLNYHHLRYFQVIARENSVTRAAKLLNVSPSALSTQLRQLEASLGRPLFDRQHKALVLTEAGRLALDYADVIFRAGEELRETFSGGESARQPVLRIGAMATLSRNFQLEFVRPALRAKRAEVILRSGNLRELKVLLEAYQIDLILTTETVPADPERRLVNHLIAEHPVSLVAARGVRVPRVRFPLNLREVPLVLPGRLSAMRAPFDALLVEAGVQARIAAEVDDMAMLRLLAREGVGVALVPPVVVADELRDGRLREVCRVPGLSKRFYAITIRREFPNPLVDELLAEAKAAGRRVE